MQKTEKLHGHEVESVEEISVSGTFESVNEAKEQSKQHLQLSN
jgi:hypothetical protein